MLLPYEPLHDELSDSQVQKLTDPNTRKRHMLQLLDFRLSRAELLITLANTNLKGSTEMLCTCQVW